VTDPHRYPQETAFIAADQEGFGAILAEAVADIDSWQSPTSTAARYGSK